MRGVALAYNWLRALLHAGIPENIDFALVVTRGNQLVAVDVMYQSAIHTVNIGSVGTGRPDTLYWPAER